MVAAQLVVQRHDEGHKRGVQGSPVATVKLRGELGPEPDALFVGELATALLGHTDRVQGGPDPAADLGRAGAEDIELRRARAVVGDRHMARFVGEVADAIAVHDARCRRRDE